MSNAFFCTVRVTPAKPVTSWSNAEPVKYEILRSEDSTWKFHTARGADMNTNKSRTPGIGSVYTLRFTSKEHAEATCPGIVWPI